MVLNLWYSWDLSDLILRDNSFKLNCNHKKELQKE